MAERNELMELERKKWEEKMQHRRDKEVEYLKNREKRVGDYEDQLQNLRVQDAEEYNVVKIRLETDVQVSTLSRSKPISYAVISLDQKNRSLLMSHILQDSRFCFLEPIFLLVYIISCDKKYDIIIWDVNFVLNWPDFKDYRKNIVFSDCQIHCLNI